MPVKEKEKHTEEEQRYRGYKQTGNYTQFFNHPAGKYQFEYSCY